MRSRRHIQLLIGLTLLMLVALGCHWIRHIKSEQSSHTRTVLVNGIKASLKYLPPAAMMVNDLNRYRDEKTRVSRDTQLSAPARAAILDKMDSELRQRRAGYQRYLHFRLTLEYEDLKKDVMFESMKGGQANYSRWLQKLSFGLQQQLSLQTDSGEQIPVELYHLEPNFGLNHSVNLLLAFPASHDRQAILDSTGHLKVNINDFGLGTGPLIFEYDLPLQDFK